MAVEVSASTISASTIAAVMTISIEVATTTVATTVSGAVEVTAAARAISVGTVVMACDTC